MSLKDYFTIMNDEKTNRTPSKRCRDRNQVTPTIFNTIFFLMKTKFEKFEKRPYHNTQLIIYLDNYKHIFYTLRYNVF